MHLACVTMGTNKHGTSRTQENYKHNFELF